MVIVACAQAPNEPGYQPSTSKLPLNQRTFAQYQYQTKQWLAQNRHFLTQYPERELAANTPFEIKANKELTPSRGVLLVHGLLDSPYSFVDIAPRLAAMGFTVRTVLLEGHGSKPANLLQTDADNWYQLVDEQVAIFKQEVDELYLGGFSTGANLTTHYGMNDDDIAGLMLFSPGFKAFTELDVMAPVVPWFTDWLYAPSLKHQTNYVRYMTGPSNAYAQYYRTSDDILALFERQTFDKPVFMALSETDSIINPHRALDIFTKRMTHHNSHLIWFGNAPTLNEQPVLDSRVTVLPGKVPEYQVSNYSHMGLLFSTDNSYYGVNGRQRFCVNGQQQGAYGRCVRGQDVWFSAYGYVEPNKEHARLTFNPWFEQMMKSLEQVFFNVP